MKKNTETVRKMDSEIMEILIKTNEIRKKLNENYRLCLTMYGRDYSNFSDEEKQSLGAIVNLTKTLSVLYQKTLDMDGGTE